MSTELVGTSDPFLVCYAPKLITSNGIFVGDKPVNYSLMLFVIQTAIVIFLTRILYRLLKPFGQPRFIAEIIGGIILGPTFLGRVPNFIDTMFPTRSVYMLETMANLGLVYFVFLVGLQIDVCSLKCMGRRAWVVAASSVALPFFIEIMAFVVFGARIREKTYNDAYLLFLGVSLSVTAFSVLGRILAELKLLNTETGRLAMSSAIITDGLAWNLLAIAIALTGNHRNGLSSLGVICSGAALVVVTYVVVRPACQWIMSHTREGEPVDDIYLSTIILAVLAVGVMADFVGIHAVFGGFAVGCAIPDGPLVSALTEKLEDFVSGLLLPLYFGSVGAKVNLLSLTDVGISGFLAGVILFSAVGKVGATMVVSTSIYGVAPREGLLLGVLMNTKGIMEIVVLRIALEKKVLYTQSYSMMIVMSLLLTASVMPLARLLSRKGRNLVSYKRRMLQRLKPDGEFRVLACMHTARNVSSIVNLVDISHPTKNSPIFVCALHLMELTGRESAMLAVHDAHRSLGTAGKRQRYRGTNLNRTQAQSEQIMSMLESYEQHAAGVSVFPMAVVSGYNSMHEDVMHIAEDKRSALLILPFHKHQTVDGGMELTNAGIRTVNQNIMADPPCSVAVLVDRGLGGIARLTTVMGRHTSHHIALLFFGGADDREALAYVARMAQHPGINVTILRFIDARTVSPGRTSNPKGDFKESYLPDLTTDKQRQRYTDDGCIKDFRVRHAGDDSVVYVEKFVSNGEETMTVLRSMDNGNDLYVVGRGDGVENPLTTGLTDWSECPELGPIGDLLASSDFASTVSVLVVQQYKGDELPAMEPGSPPETPKSGFWGCGDQMKEKLTSFAS